MFWLRLSSGLRDLLSNLNELSENQMDYLGSDCGCSILWDLYTCMTTRI